MTKRRVAASVMKSFFGFLVLSATFAVSKGEAQGCADCVNALTCAATEDGYPGCSYSPDSGCQVDMGICATAFRQDIERDLKLQHTDFLAIDVSAGSVLLAPVGDSRYAMWDCATRELTHLYQKEENGSLNALDLELHKQDYSYDRVSALIQRRAST
jgi:hypothetical protein